MGSGQWRTLEETLVSIARVHNRLVPAYLRLRFERLANERPDMSRTTRQEHDFLDGAIGIATVATAALGLIGLTAYLIRIPGQPGFLFLAFIKRIDNPKLALCEMKTSECN